MRSSGSRNVAVVNSEVTGKVDGVYQGHFGIYATNSSGVTIANNNVHDVDSGIGTGGCVEHHKAALQIDQPVARAKRPPLAGRGAVAADAELGDGVIELDLEPVTLFVRRLVPRKPLL